MRKITITFSHLPFSQLNPNNLRRTHWAVRSEASSVARTEAYLAGRELGISLPIELCEIEEIFTVPTKRRCDIEAYLGAMKPAMDGIVDAGIILDDDWKHVRKLSGVIRYEKGVEKTELIIREVRA